MKEGVMSVWRAPVMRCRRSPRQFQNTMVGLIVELLAINRRRGAKDGAESG